ncbi:ACT domain-containing protein [Lysobacter sp. 5GHs7-4]|uniref:ACT domain-containing protein n=1 Tax=Lysobacter sp. 5GHs7-4 TaxID=2904253 RepID=UPI001E5ABBBC|nr:ACT domain-containing protein [Lysobacter sp. 5GHs7-4]UHQ23305.1 ACT domain-containing protein [Lysobacter sp. 5GHs7-4]
MTAASAAPPVAERDLALMLASLDVQRRVGDYVFVACAQADAELAALAHASVREDEGISYVLARADADARGLTYGFVAAWLSLCVHSALDAVGLTAAVSAALAEDGIACNVLAGFHHDHLLVPADRAADAVAALAALRRPADAR